MPNPSGRPRKDNKMDILLQIRMDREMAEKLAFCSNSMKKAKSEVIREGIEILYRRETLKGKDK